MSKRKQGRKVQVCSQPRDHKLADAGFLERLVLGTFVILALCVSSAISTKLDLEKDIELQISGSANTTSASVAFVTPIWAVSQSDNKQGQNVPAVLDVSFNFIMLPEKTTQSADTFGIVCDTVLNCDIYGGQDTCAYVGVDVSPNCQNAETVLQFQNYKDASPSPPMINFKLFTPNQNWVANYGPNGVLGLGPLSPFWSYLNNNFTKPDSQDYIEVSVAYKTENVANAIDPTKVQFTESYLTINGRFGINEPVTQPFVLQSNQTFGVYPVWVFTGAEVNYLSGILDRKGSLCVDNTANTFFISVNATAIKKSVSRQLCGLDTGCVSSNSNLKNVKPIKITFSNSEKSFSMSVSPDEFINFDSNTGQAIIGVSDVVGTKCAIDPGYSVLDGVGRLFLTKVEFIIRVKSDNSFDIGFNEISYPNDTLFLVILLALAVIILAIIVGIMIMSVVDKRRAKATSGKQSATENAEGGYFKPSDS